MDKNNSQEYGATGNQSLTSASEEPNTTADASETSFTGETSTADSSGSNSSSSSGNNASSESSSTSDATQSKSSSSAAISSSDNRNTADSEGTMANQTEVDSEIRPAAIIVITGPAGQSPRASSCRWDLDADADADATAFEDAQSNRWLSSQEEATNSVSGPLDPASCENFATPAAVSMTADDATVAFDHLPAVAAAAAAADFVDAAARRTLGINGSSEYDDENDQTALPQQPSASLLLTAGVLEDTAVLELPASMPSRSSNDHQEVTIDESQILDNQNQNPPLQQQQQQPRLRSTPPRGVYGGPGTAFPPILLRRRLAAFPVVLPYGAADAADVADAPVDCRVDPLDSETAAKLADRLVEWESADSDGCCGVCQRGANKPNSGGFLGYPVCGCPQLHAQCTLVGALLNAPDQPRCLGCGCLQQLHRTGRVKPLLYAGCRDSGVGRGPLGEAWFIVAMTIGLSTSAALLAVSAALLLTLAEPLTRGLMAGADLPLLACLFSLLALALLACFLIGWLLDRNIGAVWEQVYSSRLQIAYKLDRLTDACDRVLAASLMACTFLDYRPVGYPFPKRGSAFVSYFCLRQPPHSGVSRV